jgi:Leucine-rich repeat (LRR) protein
VKALIMAGKKVPPTWVPFGTELNLVHSGLTDVTPLAGLTALQSLGLGGTQVTDATPLAGLTALEELDLTGTRVTDVSPLRQPKLKIVGGPGGLVRAASAIRRTLFNPKP